MKKITSVLLSIVMLISVCCFNASASNDNTYDETLARFQEFYRPFAEEGDRRVKEIANSPNPEEWLGVERENLPLDTGKATRDLCNYCSGRVLPVCAADMVLMQEGYHKGFSGLTLVDCHKYLYGSHGAMMCLDCHRVIELFDFIHDCREYHIHCSRGDYRVCSYVH